MESKYHAGPDIEDFVVPTRPCCVCGEKMVAAGYCSTNGSRIGNKVVFDCKCGNQATLDRNLWLERKH